MYELQLNNIIMNFVHLFLSLPLPRQFRCLGVQFKHYSVCLFLSDANKKPGVMSQLREGSSPQSKDSHPAALDYSTIRVQSVSYTTWCIKRTRQC